MGPEPERFKTATEQGEVINKDGYHQPGNRGPFMRPRGCGCTLTTDKGAYRDVSVSMPDGRKIHYYHQSPVVVEDTVSGVYRLSSCGYRTATTKERINRYIPSGYFVRQEDFEWYLEKPDGSREPFHDGMILHP